MKLSKSKLRQLALWFILIDFAAFSTWVLWQHGYLGIWQAGFTSPASLQILLDLAICCFLICSWIKADAQSRGINPYPWMVATFASGSLAPLVYLIVREYQKDEPRNLNAQAA
jgi:hypothetical protein